MRESELLDHIYRANRSLDDRVTIPPGDDMALVVTRAGGGLLAAVDQLVDGRHVRVDRTPLALVGRKAVTRCLSDVAAMAARPLASLAAATLPTDFGSERAQELFDAMRSVAASYDAPLIGGDVAIQEREGSPLVCAVTVLAEPLGTPVRRRGTRPSDAIYVTGCLGGTLTPDGLGHHLTFEPRISVAAELASRLGERLHAMIDLSDGLGRDLAHLAMDDITLAIDTEALPCRAGCDWRAALRDGEDYELCFCASGVVPDAIDGVAVTRIGDAIERAAGAPPLALRTAGRALPWPEGWGWEHRG